MGLITFTSDFGTSDHYVAAVKAKILSEKPDQSLVDISHDIEPFNAAHLAFVLKSVFRDFPEQTVHLIGMNGLSSGKDAYLVAELENHWFVCPDNGILGLLSEKQPTQLIRPELGEELTNFPTKDVLVPLAMALANGTQASSLGTAIADYQRLMSRQVKATRREIVGHVIRIDHYGNLITNIKKLDFDILSKNRRYEIHFGREVAHAVHKRYHEVDPGEVFFVFNSLDVLEIGINQGNGAMLLGLEYDSPITIQFTD